MTIILQDIGVIYSLLTAKYIDLSLLISRKKSNTTIVNSVRGLRASSPIWVSGVSLARLASLAQIGELAHRLFSPAIALAVNLRLIFETGSPLEVCYIPIYRRVVFFF